MPRRKLCTSNDRSGFSQSGSIKPQKKGFDSVWTFLPKGWIGINSDGSSWYPLLAQSRQSGGYTCRGGANRSKPILSSFPYVRNKYVVWCSNLKIHLGWIGQAHKQLCKLYHLAKLIIGLDNLLMLVIHAKNQVNLRLGVASFIYIYINKWLSLIENIRFRIKSHQVNPRLITIWSKT